MRMIFVTGIDESNRDEITDMVMLGLKKQLPNFRYLKFSRFVKLKKDGSGNWQIGKLEGMKKIQKKFHRNLNKEILRAKKTNTYVVLNSYLTLKTEHGYLPLVGEDFFEHFRPNILLVLEVETNLNSHQIRRSFGSIDGLNAAKEQQNVNRDFAVRYSSLCDSVLRVIKVHPDSIKDALKEVSETIRFGIKE